MTPIRTERYGRIWDIGVLPKRGISSTLLCRTGTSNDAYILFFSSYLHQSHCSLGKCSVLGWIPLGEKAAKKWTGLQTFLPSNWHVAIHPQSGHTNGGLQASWHASSTGERFGI
jgi:hypothetical protein